MNTSNGACVRLNSPGSIVLEAAAGICGAKTDSDTAARVGSQAFTVKRCTRTDSDTKPGSDESVSRQTDCSSHSSPSRRSHSHRTPPIHPATLAPTAPRGSATGRRRRSCRGSQRRSALQQPSSPARRARQRPSCAIYQPRGLHMARGRRERILSQHPMLGGVALPTGPV
jgi:hypothetical protein